MHDSVIATREVLWNIPFWMKATMYGLLAVALAFFFLGVHKKVLFITGGKGWRSLVGQNGLVTNFKDLSWTNFIKTIALAGKVSRDPSVGFFHGLIYYGFIILWIATDIVAIHYDTPFKIFQGTTYIVISFLADFAGIMIIAGIFLAGKRRYLQKPSKLSATKPNQERIMYVFLLALVLVGYFIEGLRILGNGMPEGERTWAPIGFGLALLFQKFNLSESSLAFFYQGLWFFHMVNTMAFVALIPYTKFFHFVAIPIQSLITKEKNGAILKPMNFENENAETFGLGKLSEMTFKNRLDLISCVECGRCTEACPAHGAGKNLNPKTIITKARDGAFREIEKGSQDFSFWEDQYLYASNELDACTTCGACMEECPANIEHVQIIMEAKRYKALTLGDLPPSAADAVNKIKINGNPWGIAQDDRFKWSEGLDVPVIEAGKKVDYLYYVGCAGSYDAANQKVVKDTIALLRKANVSFAVMGKTEKCNGDPIRRFGDEYSFYEIAIENIANMKQYTFDKVVTHCPHCLHTIGKEYAKFDDGAFQTVHHTELLAELVRSGSLKPEKAISQSLTFHDPCYLGRHHGEYNAPREILKAIPGVKLNEMAKAKDKSLCCGMGGGNMWYELPEGEHLANNRLKEVGQVTQEKLATACSFCMINFNSAKGHIESTKNLDIEDVASILAKSAL